VYGSSSTLPPLSHKEYACRPPLPHLLDAPFPTDPLLRRASRSLNSYLADRTSHDDIDSLVIAVVTPSGPVFQKGYGVLRANETDSTKRGSVDENSIYRLASVTKIFTVLETLILRDRGVLNWYGLFS